MQILRSRMHTLTGKFLVQLARGAAQRQMRQAGAKIAALPRFPFFK